MVKGGVIVTSAKIVLSGGPERFSGRGHVRSSVEPEEKVKILFGAGYEHFVHNGEFLTVDGESLPIFQWSGRTKIAE